MSSLQRGIWKSGIRLRRKLRLFQAHILPVLLYTVPRHGLWAELWRRSWMSYNVGPSGRSCASPSQRTFYNAELSWSGPGSGLRNGPRQENPAIRPCNPLWHRPREGPESNDQWSTARLEEACGPPTTDVTKRDHGRLAPLERWNKLGMETSAEQRPLASGRRA